MKIAIVYDSKTGTTKAAADQMAAKVRDAGHECTVAHVEQADPSEAAAADARCVGRWSKGVYVVFQGPTRATVDFIRRLGPLDGKPAAVFATYAIAIGRTLDKMAAAMAAQGADVTGRFGSKGPNAAAEFEGWLATLTESTMGAT
ncbi:MAG: flavodoxin domain-containing protein [Myxococcota bacterium]